MLQRCSRTRTTLLQPLAYIFELGLISATWVVSSANLIWLSASLDFKLCDLAQKFRYAQDHSFDDCLRRLVSGLGVFEIHLETYDIFVGGSQLILECAYLCRALLQSLLEDIAVTLVSI